MNVDIKKFALDPVENFKTATFKPKMSKNSYKDRFLLMLESEDTKIKEIVKKEDKEEETKFEETKNE